MIALTAFLAGVIVGAVVGVASYFLGSLLFGPGIAIAVAIAAAIVIGGCVSTIAEGATYNYLLSRNSLYKTISNYNKASKSFDAELSDEAAVSLEL